ncbi:MAG: carboxypeptidase-like regulatory domain-containing protein [Acidobacteria bacterium]|nr:carboxypeptidase-like regulatory domain-containing protein [Acidobacteriota bacterium]MCI0719713.1 carboxypeptidase-like regulatory domain-containing protein [Acidobacteriota bacterium]
MRRRFILVLGTLVLALARPTAAQQQAPPASSGQQAGAPQAGADKPGAIKGRVVAADTGSGLRRVRVMLQGSESRPGTNPQTSQTNENGEYEIKEVKPGRYTLMVMRNGYVPQTYGQKSADPMSRGQGTQLTIRAGETLGQVNLQMIRGGAVEGQITDQNNEPLSRVMVQLTRYRTFQGKRNLMPVSMANTDDRGHFRLFEIPPGSYYLSATYRSFGFPDGGGAFPPTYYPGALSPQEATKIQVNPAGEITGINLALTEMVSFTISGKVLGSDGKPASGARLMSMRHPPEADFGMMFGGGGVDPDGNFKLSNMLPGKYRLTASTGREGKTESGSVIVEVGNEDLQNISVGLGNGAEVAGKIIVEGQATQPIEPRQIRVTLVPDAGPMMGFFGGGPQVTSDDLTFRQNVSEGSSRFNVNLPSGNFYLKSIRMEGRDVTDQAIDFKNNDRYHGVEVLISSQGGQLSGVVRKEEGGEALKGATVVFFAADPERQGKTRFTKTAQTDQQGSFVARGLVPGEYVVCALLNHEAGAESDVSYLREIEKLGKRVELTAGAAKTENLVAVAGPAAE